MHDIMTLTAPASTPGTHTQGITLSISAVRRMLTCGESERLVRAGHRQQPNAALWYGRIVHEIIALGYRGADLELAFGEIWTRECGGILPLLDQWAELHDDRIVHGGRAGSKARTAWEAAHPAYATLTAAIAAYQERVLGHYRWSKTGSVADYYHRCRTLIKHHAHELLLGGAVLVEGALVDDLPEGSTVRAEALELGGFDEGDETRRYARLAGTLGRVRVVGVPDVVAYDAATNVWRVADYKTAKTQLTAQDLYDDAQLRLYLHLLVEAGIIPLGARVEIGHLYLGAAVT